MLDIAGMDAAELEKSIEKITVWRNIILLRTAMVDHKTNELKINVSENFSHKGKVKCRNKVLTIINHKQSQKTVCDFFLPQNPFLTHFFFQRQNFGKKGCWV